jgi:hypothetical protein
LKSVAAGFLKAAKSQIDVIKQSDLTTELLAEMVWHASKFESAKIMFQVQHTTHKKKAVLNEFVGNFLADVFSHQSFWMTMILSSLGMEIECNDTDFVRKINKWIADHESTKARNNDNRRKRNQAQALKGKAFEAADNLLSDSKKARVQALKYDSD